jgi:hypothetical protein
MIRIQSYSKLFSSFGSTVLEIESLAVRQKLSELPFLVIVTYSF